MYRVEVELAGEGGNIGCPEVAKGGRGAEMFCGGAEVYKFVGGAVEANYFPAHDIPEFVA